jgi:general secretion pathway protein G
MIQQKKGFTLIELLVVGTILAVIAAGAVVSYASVNVKSRDSKRMSDVEQVRSALEMYRADYGSYIVGAWGVALPTLKAGNYIDKTPIDPKTGYTYYYNSGTGSVYNICSQVEGPTPASQACVANTTCGSPYNYCVKNP